MSIEIKAPTFPESVADGTVATWHKQPGEACASDELIVDIETDKVVLEVVAPADGVIAEILAGEGETVLSDQVIAKFEAGAAASAAPAAAAEAPAAEEASGSDKVGPAARKLIEEHGLSAANITGTGKNGGITKEDVQRHIDSAKAAPVAAPAAPAAAAPAPAAAAPAVSLDAGARVEKRVPMTRLRATIAKRLVDAQQNAAMLTTYNEVNMKPVMDLRKQYKELFEKRHNGAPPRLYVFLRKSCYRGVEALPSG